MPGTLEQASAASRPVAGAGYWLAPLVVVYLLLQDLQSPSSRNSFYLRWGHNLDTRHLHVEQLQLRLGCVTYLLLDALNTVQAADCMLLHVTLPAGVRPFAFLGLASISLRVTVI